MNALALALVLATRTVFSFTDPAIEESSGLVDLGSLMVTTNDSGDGAVLYTIDPGTGETVGRRTYAGSVEDVEALAPAGSGEVWAGDIGDNSESRSSVRVYRVPVGRGDRRVEAPSYELTYPDGPHDAESLLFAGGRLYLISKQLFGGTVYAAPRRLDPGGPNSLRKTGHVGLFATDAAMLNDGRHVLVRGYGDAEVRTFPGFRPVASFTLPDQEQGEGISVGPGGRIRLSSEGAHSPVLQIALPPGVRRALEPTPEASPRASPGPTAHAAGDNDTDAAPLLPAALLALVTGVVAAVIAVAGWRWQRRKQAKGIE